MTTVDVLVHRIRQVVSMQYKVAGQSIMSMLPMMMVSLQC